MHKLVRVGLLTLALVFAGEAKAQAAWTTLESGYGGVFLACKTPENGGYGPVWKVTLVLTASAELRPGSHSLRGPLSPSG